VSLTAHQKVAGMHFRGSMLAHITHELPPAGAKCTPYLREYRHDCASRGGVSWPLRLKEVTRDSPGYLVCKHCSRIIDPGMPPEDCPECAESVLVDAGLFSYTWLEGSCRCGLTVRSGTGRFVVRG
jgi:hypothetical protein